MSFEVLKPKLRFLKSSLELRAFGQHRLARRSYQRASPARLARALRKYLGAFVGGKRLTMLFLFAKNPRKDAHKHHGRGYRSRAPLRDTCQRG
jgi:hypothetical protein